MQIYTSTIVHVQGGWQVIGPYSLHVTNVWWNSHTTANIPEKHNRIWEWQQWNIKSIQNLQLVINWPPLYTLAVKCLWPRCSSICSTIFHTQKLTYTSSGKQAERARDDIFAVSCRAITLLVSLAVRQQITPAQKAIRETLSLCFFGGGTAKSLREQLVTETHTQTLLNGIRRSIHHRLCVCVCWFHAKQLCGCDITGISS